MQHCEEHSDRIAISRVNLRGIQQRRCAECHDRDVRMQRVELIEAGYAVVVEDEEPPALVQLSLFNRAA
jgi:transcriptional regulator NrdR family protein